jgi:hypothetical protein
VHLLDATAAWAAAAGINKDCLKLEAACAPQMRRVGIDRAADPQRLAHLERARTAVDEETRAELERTGGGLSYGDALGLVAQVLSAVDEDRLSVSQV